MPISRCHVVLVTCCLLLLSGETAQAQFAPRIVPTNENLDDVFSPAPRELRQRIKYAREALDDGRFTEASALLGNLVAGNLEESDNQDYFIEVPDDPNRKVSVKAEAQRMIGFMPAAGREIYELQFGAEARQMLDKALATGDLQLLAEVTRMYFHSRAGYEASMLLGRYYLDRGKPLAAALTLRSLADYPAAVSQYDPDLSLMLATCWMLADMPKRAEETLQALQERNPKAEFSVQGIAATLPGNRADLLDWLEDRIGGRPQFNRLMTEQWAMHRGEPGRNAESKGGAPIYHPRWVSALNMTSDEDDLITQVREVDFLANNIAPLPATQPLAVGETVLVRTPSFLMGINFRTGKRVWTFPWDEASDWEASLTPGGGNSQANDQRREQLKQRLFYDSPYGQLASDGKSVFMIDDLGFAAIGGRSHFIKRGGVRERNPMWASNSNQLMALNIEREGALNWTVGGQTGEDEPKLAGAFFLGPPLPLMGQLFVMAEMNGEIRLIVLDADNGRYLWSQQLAVVGQFNILTDQTRRLAGASPSFANGVLICPTSAGAVVAVDISTRTLLWGFTYKSRTNSIPNRWQLQQRGNSEQVPTEFWADATVAIAAGKVLVTPRESNEMYCLDLLTGKPMWPAKDRGGLVYQACVHDDAGIFVGNERVTAIQLDDGTPAWEEDIVLSDLPSGRGFYSDQYYFLPLMESKLLKIDLNTGKVAQTFETEHALGNLICFRDQVISLTPHTLETYYQAEPLRELVKARLKENPNDPEALAQHAELLLQEGNQSEALTALRKAWQLEPDDFRVSRLLAKTMLTALKADFEQHRDVAKELESLVEGSEQTAEYLRLMASGHRKLGDAEKAFEYYMELAGELTGDSSSLELDALDEVARFHGVRRDRWLQSQLIALLDDADEKQSERIEQKIRQRIDAAITADKLANLRQANALFGFTEGSEQIQLRMAELLIEFGSPLEAEVILTFLQDSGEADVARTASYQLAVLLEKANKLPEALQQYRWMAEAFGEDVISADKAATQLMTEFVDRHKETPLVGTTGNWASGRAIAGVENTRSARRPSYQRIYPITVREQRGASPVGMQVAYDQARNDILITSGWGQELQRASLQRTDGRRFYLSNYNVTSYDALGHLVLATVGSEVVAIDTMAALRRDETDHSAIMWRHDTFHTGENTIRLQSKGIQNPWGNARYVGIDNAGRRVGISGPITRNGVCVHRSVEIVCLDPLTGKALWKRRDVEPGSDLFGDHEVIFVVPPQGEARVFRMLDGKEIDLRAVPTEAQRWKSFGRKLLCWQRSASVQPNGQMALYLMDALTGDTLWSKDFVAGTRATQVGSDQVATLTPAGQFQILSLPEGEVLHEQTLDLDAPLAALYVMPSSRDYLVAAALQRPRANSNTSSIQPQPSGLYAPLFDGKIWCLDRQTGDLRWQSPADIDRFGLPLDQPAETPVLVLLRQITTLTRNGTRRAHCSALLIDKRDGRQLFLDDQISTQAYTYGLVGDPQNDRVTLELPGFEVLVNFSDEPRPPQPPYQGEYAADTNSGPGSQPTAPRPPVADPFGRPIP